MRAHGSDIGDDDAATAGRLSRRLVKKRNLPDLSNSERDRLNAVARAAIESDYSAAEVDAFLAAVREFDLFEVRD